MSDELKPCPFCGGGGETHIVDNGRVWNGTKHSDPVSVSVRHWCVKVPGQPSRAIERVGRDEQSAIKAWNMRADATPPAQPRQPLSDAAYLRDLVEALDGAFISSWQSTAAWQTQLDAARDYLDERAITGDNP